MILFLYTHGGVVVGLVTTTNQTTTKGQKRFLLGFHTSTKPTTKCATKQTSTMSHTNKHCWWPTVLRDVCCSRPNDSADYSKYSTYYTQKPESNKAIFTTEEIFVRDIDSDVEKNRGRQRAKPISRKHTCATSTFISTENPTRYLWQGPTNVQTTQTRWNGKKRKPTRNLRQTTHQKNVTCYYIPGTQEHRPWRLGCCPVWQPNM